LPYRRVHKILTQVLHILIGDELGHDLRHTARDTPGKVALVDDNSIGHGGRDEGQTVRDSGGGRVVVEEDEGQGIAEDGEEQGEVAGLQVSILILRFRGKRLSSAIPIRLTYPTNQANL
jgi:hypothetical protein